MKEKYVVKIHQDRIVLSEVVKEGNLDLCIVNDNLSDCQEVNLNLLEVVIFTLKKRHLFGVRGLNPIINYNPNTMSKKQYFKVIQKALKFLGIAYVK